jgi:hypothetical protein
MKQLRFVAGLLVGLVGFTAAGCGGRQIDAESPYGGQGGPMRQPVNQQPRQGMSTKQKMLLLAGAAAVYYMYKKHQNKQGEGPNGKYYLSKNGRVYYRDLKTGQYQWVDPPRQPISVPAEEYERYVGRGAGGYGGYGGSGDVIRDAPADWPGSRAYGGYR